jgi:amidase
MSAVKHSKQDAMEIGKLDAHSQARLLQKGEISAVELVDAAIVRIEHLDPTLNALTHKAYAQARERASKITGRHGLEGVPYLLKDGLDYPGMPSRSGSRSKAANGIGGDNHAYGERLDDMGLIPLGKSNVPEFGLLPTTESLLYGPARNPWALDRSCGGSSGGSAVAVASGMVPLAHAADGGGSIRIPASCCGVFGLKPGRGGNLRARGQHVIEDLLVGDTLLTRTVRDAAWAVRALREDVHPSLQPAGRRLRIGVVMANLSGELPHADVAEVVRRTADLCVGLGHEVETVSLPIDGPAVVESFRVIWGYLANDIVSQCANTAKGVPLQEILEPWTLDLAQWSRHLQPEQLEHAFDTLSRTTAELELFFLHHDLTLSPVVKDPPVPVGYLAPTKPFEALMRDMFEYVSYTPLHNMTGNPAMSVPLFTTAAGLPIGSMFAAARGGEETLLELAYELERASPWAGRWPQHSVASV